VTDDSGVAIVMADREGIIRFWNESAERLFGHSTTTAIGQTLDLIVPEERRAAHWAGFGAAMAKGKTKLDQPAAFLPVLFADGTIRRFPGRLIFLRDPAGQAIGAMGVFRSSADGDGPSLPRI
jgi:PAS domain S-box-containing protein